ncbi:DNA primase [Rudaeicoccus suwonensis]|uniref:DNA primase n=1 Tax=Rudaeicoccus suwonensis TaxID=657409 RepID=A0A561E9Z2_9MICO|nr:DNA primase [Rudaeicoccus suwonensis]TWE12390.1 DNA primase [Rudaeicoccus suwonensis]
MAGRIKAEDVELVKERSSIEDVVREHVTLRRSGANLMGLCPFHDEKSPSFSVNPGAGFYHCFGCQKGGDVISFVMEVEHLTFTEAIERLAGKAGVELHYEDGPRPRDESVGRRGRLIEAHRVAAEFYAEALIGMPEARAGRDFLRARGFDSGAAARFGVGFAPRGGQVLADRLRQKGFSEEELVLGGLVGRGQRRIYDRFRGRLVWPIRDITGDTIGFGARRLYDDDRIEAKYLNTAETPVYKKQQVLYGLDLAKKSIAADRKAVVVEGYTDVMAAHLSGVEQAVATCGTSFGVDHIKLLRRLIRDESSGVPARVVFTFDGDAAGQKAALKAYEQDQRWASQSYVAVAADGQDPCELRQSGGDEALRALIDGAVPMFEFAARMTIARFDLDSVEGRVYATRAVAPIVAGIRDDAMRNAQLHEVAQWLGVSLEQMAQEVRKAPKDGFAKAAAQAGQRTRDADRAPEPAPYESGMPMPDLSDPIVRAEHMLLQCLVQFPSTIPVQQLELIDPAAFTAPAHRAVFETALAVGIDTGRSQAGWVSAISDNVPQVVRPMVAALAVEPLPTKLDSQGVPDWHYVRALIVRVREIALRRQIGEAMSALRRSDDAERSRAISVRLTDLQRTVTELLASLE